MSSAAPVLAAAGLFFAPSALFTSEPMARMNPSPFSISPLPLAASALDVVTVILQWYARRRASRCIDGGTATAPRGTPSAVAP